MASTNHTTNLNLNQWLATDPVIREDFNADNAKLDTAIAAKTEIVVGIYQGDGASSRDFALGFRPKAILITTKNGNTYSNGYTYGGLFLDGHPLTDNTTTGSTAAIITDTGFTVYHAAMTSQGSFVLNSSSTYYHYIAFQ